jgi:serralysin
MTIDLVSLNDTDSGLTVELDNTADYNESERGIIANLDTAKVLSPVYEITEQPTILTLGDSITAGEHLTDPTPGAYRLQLENNFVEDDLSIDFIGSQVNEETDLEDAEHEGHPGWTINQLTTLIDEGLLTNYQPDVILLMAGINDILRSDQASKVIEDFNQLIDRLQAESPDTEIFVSSLVPLDSDLGQGRANTVQEVNALLPELVEQQGENVTYVNAGGSLDLSDLVADGIHPNAAGYQEIGNAWYDALVGRDTLTGIEHITGTGFSDRITGNDQANILFGNGGADVLSGGEGSDRFLYENLDSETDTIADFSMDDRLVFSASGFDTSLGIETNLTEAVVISDLDGLPSSTGATFVYQADTGLLSFDPDGNGSIAASDIAFLSNLSSLSQEQISVIA